MKSPIINTPSNKIVENFNSKRINREDARGSKLESTIKRDQSYEVQSLNSSFESAPKIVKDNS